MKFIDSHCHPQFPQYNLDREEVVKRTLNEGVKMICVGTDLEMSKKGIELAQKHDGIWATAGIHPNDLKEGFDIEDYKPLINDKIIAIGEIGLDYYRTKGDVDQEKQREVLIQWLDLVKNMGLPLIIHCREAYSDMLEILDKYPEVKGVIHSFTSDWNTAKKFIDRGFLIGLNGIISFTDQYNDTVVNISLDSMLLETDAPFLSPVPYRGKRNEPWHVKFVAQRISELRGDSVEEIARATTQNVVNLFGLYK